MNSKVNLAQIVGGVFIAIGILGAVGWLLAIDSGSSLDTETIEEDLDIELETDVFDTSEAEEELIKQERDSKIIYAILTLLSGVAIGAIIYTLGTIQGLLEIQVSGSKTGYFFNADSIEQENLDKTENKPVNDDVVTAEEENKGFNLDSSGKGRFHE